MIFAEAVSFGPEMLLLFAVALLVYVAAGVGYVVGGFIAIRRVAAGVRSPGTVVLAGVAMLIGAWILVVCLVERSWSGAIVFPAIHGLAAWLGRRAAAAADPAGTPRPPPPPPPPAGPPRSPG